MSDEERDRRPEASPPGDAAREVGGPIHTGGQFSPYQSEIHGTPRYGGPMMAHSGRAPHAPQQTTPSWAAARRNGHQPRPEPESYYGHAIVKPPEWTPEIAWYFFIGGMGGVSATLAYGSDLAGNRRLARRAWPVALGALSVSPVLLIYDLGRPERFLNMLRVFKVTSPMSVGSWILTGMGASTALATADEMLGLLPRLGAVAKPAAAVLGTGLATYTAALVGDTAIPVWHAGRRELPFVFAGSAMASAGAAATLLTPGNYAAPARSLTVLGAALETAAAQRMEQRIGEPINEPYRRGTSGRYSKLARACTVAGALTVALAARRSRTGALAGGTLALAGSAFERFAVFHAGTASARDPSYTVRPQRRRREQHAAAGA